MSLCGKKETPLACALPPKETRHMLPATPLTTTTPLRPELGTLTTNKYINSITGNLSSSTEGVGERNAEHPYTTVVGDPARWCRKGCIQCLP